MLEEKKRPEGAVVSILANQDAPAFEVPLAHCGVPERAIRPRPTLSLQQQAETRLHLRRHSGLGGRAINRSKRRELGFG